MFRDRYGNPLATQSEKARDHYCTGLDGFLAADGGVAKDLEAAIEADPGFSLAHLVLARFWQVTGNRDGALRELGAANDASQTASAQEQSLIAAFKPLIEGRPQEALTAIQRHLGDYPRDAIALSTCTTVFGLIGFSGLPGREAEQLALTSALASHYGDDWWFLSQHAFAQVEVGQLDAATRNIERSYEINPRSAQMAHVRSHVFYESGDPDAGYQFLNDWLPEYNRGGLLHGHLSWHLSLWALERGDLNFMWRLVDEGISPSASSGPPLVKLCDTSAVLYRASLKGVVIPADRWKAISDYASSYFPETGIAFGDVHAAVAHAMARNMEPLSRIASSAKGPANDVVRPLASAFRAIASESWETALGHLLKGMNDHARIGGSKAQRDLLEFTLFNVLLKLGRKEEAKRLLSLRRPIWSQDEMDLDGRRENPPK